jgi:hypothetical protein
MRITTALLLSLLLVPQDARAQGPQLQLDHLDRLSAAAAETVNITIDPAMLKLAGAVLKDDRKNPEFTAMLNDLKGIYIRSFEFDRENAYTPEDVSAIRKQLAAPGWSRLVEVDSKRERELVEIYSWREGSSSGGLAILVAEPQELTIVNIVGPIDLTRLGALQGQFGIPQLPAVGR